MNSATDRPWPACCHKAIAVMRIMGAMNCSHDFTLYIYIYYIYYIYICICITQLAVIHFVQAINNQLRIHIGRIWFEPSMMVLTLRIIKIFIEPSNSHTKQLTGMKHKIGEVNQNHYTNRFHRQNAAWHHTFNFQDKAFTNKWRRKNNSISPYIFREESLVLIFLEN